MYLQRIELQGFKSFAHKAVLEFPAPGKGCLTSPNIKSAKQLPRGICGTTVIIGPNGSGKSNIVDAVRWVLGEQSLKLLRGKKSTDVIFSGSAKKTSLGLAEVSLHLNNEDQSAPVDYTEIAITRRIYRNGENEYLLNQSQVRLFDIVMLLAKANFGQNTYSVIGQGMVDRIVNYSSEERKDFFDEATGVKQYQIKRDRSVAKLERTRENLEQVGAVVRELDPHLKSLTRQVNRLKKRQAVESELRAFQEKHYGKLWLDLDSAYRELAMTFAAQEKGKMKLEEKINERQEKIDLLRQENSRSEDFDKLQREYDREISKRNEFFKSLAEVRGKLDVEYLKIGKQDLGWLESRRGKLADELKAAEGQLTELSRQAEKFQKALREKGGKQEEFLKKFRALEDKLLALQKEFKSELGISEKEIQASVNCIYSLAKDFVDRLKTTHDLDGLSRLKEEAAMVFAEIDHFYQRMTKTEKRKRSEAMADLQNNLSAFLKTKDSLASEIGEVRIRLEVSLSQRQSLKAKTEEIKAELSKVEDDLKKNQVAPKDQSEFNRRLDQEKLSLEKELKNQEEKINEIKEKIDQFNEEEEKKKQEIFATQQEMHRFQTEANKVVGEFNETKVALAKIETKKEDLFSAMRTDLGADFRPKLNPNWRSVNTEETEEKITKLKRQWELIGGTDPEAEKEYDAVKERFDFLSSQSDDLEKAAAGLEKIVLALDKTIKKQFEEEFKKINQDFSRYFKQLFEGGSAKLVLVQKEKTEAEAVREEMAQTEGMEKTREQGFRQGIRSFLADTGIDIEACPPGKKIKNVNMLSGGEKTMTALALICAIIANNPSPFILFDEVDAALDEANSAKFSDIVAELAHQTQFIIITHNRAIMARADVLYGVTMQGDGVSRLLGLKLEQAAGWEKV